MLQRTFLLLAFFLSGGVTIANATTLDQPVWDQAGLLSPKVEGALNKRLREVREAGGPQMAVIIAPQLKSGSIEQDAIDLADDLKLGSKDKDDGVILLIALKEKKIRIEVGQGLEGVLPDIQAGRIIRDVMVPLIRLNRFDEAVWLAVDHTLKLTFPQGGSESPAVTQDFSVERKKPRIIDYLIFVFYIIAFLMIVIGRLFFGRRRSFWGGGGWTSGGGFGGGYGGGGFSGGGGGFSGGGSSGGW